MNYPPFFNAFKWLMPSTSEITASAMYFSVCTSNHVCKHVSRFLSYPILGRECTFYSPASQFLWIIHEPTSLWRCGMNTAVHGYPGCWLMVVENGSLDVLHMAAIAWFGFRCYIHRYSQVCLWRVSQICTSSEIFILAMKMLYSVFFLFKWENIWNSP